MDPRWGRTAITTAQVQKPSQTAEITHPFHHLRGERFLVLRKKRFTKVPLLVLQNRTTGRRWTVPEEWTDLREPSPYSDDEAPILEYDHLLDLVDLLNDLEKH